MPSQALFIGVFRVAPFTNPPLRLKISKSKKTLVLIILVIVFKHKIKIKKNMFVYIQQSTLYEHVFS